MTSKPINLDQLILAIVSFVNEKGGYVTKTKLIKYLYLVDVEYYRLYGEKLTELNWIFYKFGPYTSEFEDYYQRLSRVQLNINKVPALDHEAEILSTREEVKLNSLLPDPKFRLKVYAILNQWAEQKLAKMLDYVYFETEPMHQPRKMELLDFSTIERGEKHQHFIISKNGVHKKMTKQLEAKLQRVKKDKIIPLEKAYPPATFGQHYWDDLNNFDDGDDY